MPLPFGKSEKEKTIRRAKALGELLLPCLVFAAIVLLSSAFTHARPAPVTAKVNRDTQASQEGWLFANTASSSDSTVGMTQGPDGTPARGAGRNPGATTVKTYTALGTF
jgi:hypothetical protein